MYQVLVRRDRARAALAGLACGLIWAGSPIAAGAQPIEQIDEALRALDAQKAADAEAQADVAADAVAPPRRRGKATPIEGVDEALRAAEAEQTVDLAPPAGSAFGVRIDATGRVIAEQESPAEPEPSEEAVATAPDESPVEAEQSRRDVAESEAEEAATDDAAEGAELAAKDEELSEGEAQPPSEEALRVVNWALASNDAGGLPFVVIDKVSAQVLVYDGDGQLQGVTPALLGLAHGDDSAEGVGDKPLSAIGPEDRTTPAGRFQARFGRGVGKSQVLWVDYATAISLHAVVYSNKKEKRLERLQSPSPEDNRITFGCINVAANFYDKIVHPLFRGKGGIVYILPETKPLYEVFPGVRIHTVQAPHPEDVAEPAAAVVKTAATPDLD